jgi:glycosyltransferase involved in cell wall biosynthesis
MKKILFILKANHHNYGFSASSGLINSVRLIVNMINGYIEDVEARYVVVTDNNDIDRVVTQYRPNVVMIEALWVVPDKFDVLKKLHPDVVWIVRSHSKSDFLSNEGMAFQWIYEYITKEVRVACNTKEAVSDIKSIVDASFVTDQQHILYLPNYYLIEVGQSIHLKSFGDPINIGCFGAIRPLKNQMNQALAVVDFSNIVSKDINFHINFSRVEGRGEPILKNLRSLFSHTFKCTLIEYPWLDHQDFLDLLYSMDISMQVSLSESFNIISADAVSQGVPVISANVPWLHKYALEGTDSVSIREALIKLYDEPTTHLRKFVKDQQRELKIFSDKSLKQWERELDRLWQRTDDRHSCDE